MFSAELLEGLHVHLPDAAELVELVDVDRAHVGVERGKDVVERDADLVSPLARSMSRNSCARRPRNVVNTRASPGCAFGL